MPNSAIGYAPCAIAAPMPIACAARTCSVWANWMGSHFAQDRCRFVYSVPDAD